MFESIKCALKGHMFVDSRSQPGTEVCVRCRYRRPFDGVVPPIKPADSAQRPLQ